MATLLRPLLRVAPLLGVFALMACGEGDKGAAPTNVKRPPSLLEFEGYVYVHPDATDLKIVQQVRAETSSAFTGLRKARVMVSRREVESIDTENFKREPVTVIDNKTGERRLATRVRYRYVARPDIVHDLNERRELPLALLHRGNDGDAQRVLRECTKNTERDKGFASAVALVFDASLESCRAAVEAEQAAIDAARAQLPGAAPGSPGQADDAVIPSEELERLYLPVRVTLDLKKRTAGEVMPRYAPLDPEETAEPAPQELEVDDSATPARPIEPAKVIVDPDLAPIVRQPEEKPGEPEVAVLSPGGGWSERTETARLPSVVGHQAQRRIADSPKEAEHIDIPFETLIDPKFMIVWLSLLLAYPILRGESRRKKN